MTKELKTLVNKLGIMQDNAVKQIVSASVLFHPFDINPEEFLERAEDDYELYELGDTSSLLNSITNAKRAIHSKIDEALMSLGFTPKRWSLREKVEKLVSLGFIAPRILKRVADARNMLEHEYSAPTSEQVEEALDLAALFIGATNRVLEAFWGEFSLGNYDEQDDLGDFRNELIFVFWQNPIHFNVIGRTNINWGQQPGNNIIIGKVFIKPIDEIYTDIVRLVVAGERESKEDEALDQFFGTLSKY